MNVYVDILANIIIQQYFINSRCIFILTEKTTIFNYYHEIPAVRVDSDNENISGITFHYFGCQEIIIKTPLPLTMLIKFEELIRLTAERFNKRKYLILPTENMKENLTGIFDLEEMHYISDLLIVTEHEDESTNSSYYEILSNKYVGQSENNAFILLDVWFASNASFLMGNNLYPNKLLNQYGRELKMATFQYEPYSVIGNTTDENYGSEMKTALMFAKKFNMTPIPVVNEFDYWGEIFSNWSGNGLMGNLVLDKADVGFSALYTWEAAYNFLDLSKPLIRTGITCLVPAPKLAAGWLTPMYAFSREIWLIIGGMFVTSTIIGSFITSCYIKNPTMILAYFKNVSDRSYTGITGITFFNVLKLFVLQTLPRSQIPQGLVGQYFFTILFLFTLILTSTYSSSLASIMTIPRYGVAINTIQDFHTSGLQWGATQDAWIMSIQNAEEQIYIDIVSRFQPISEEKLRENSKMEKFAFSLERLPNDNFAIGTYIKEDVIQNFHVMQEDFYWEQCVIMTRKNSVLLPMLDLFILKVFEAGLITYWQNEAVTVSMDQAVQKAVKFYYHHRTGERKITKLKWVNVEGAFAVLGLGYILSILAFFLEILHKLK